MSIRPQLRPLGIGDLFDAAFRLYRERFWTLIAIAALVYIPTAILRLFLWPWFFGRAWLGAFSSFSMMSFYIGSFISSTFWSLTLGNLLNGALVNAIACAYLGKPISPIGAYRFGAQRYVALVFASIIPLLISGLAGIIPGFLGSVPLLLRFLLIGPAPGPQSVLEDLPVLLFCLAVLIAFQLALLLLYAYFLLVPQAIILEGNRPTAGIARSWSLVRGSARRALGIVIATGILSFLVSSAPTLFTSLLFFRMPGMNSMLISTLLGAIGLAGQILVEPICSRSSPCSTTTSAFAERVTTSS
ncbi:MAG TPA: hypothetical protein VGJ87_08110 [Roseiflexaceae bacterium]|jgi:hypothetical protein